jgi:hypothetical protein
MDKAVRQREQAVKSAICKGVSHHFVFNIVQNGEKLAKKEVKLPKTEENFTHIASDLPLE